MELFHNLYNGFAVALTFQNILYCGFGVFFGQMIGVLPGIGAPTAIALLLPLTFTINPTSAIIMFAGIYYGVAYGGTITSVLINVPGESSTVMTCLDGYQMALQGRAGAALSVAAIGSWIAGTVSIVLLMAFAPALAKFALNFGPAEFFALTMMAFGLLTVFGGENPFKVIISTMLGLLLTTVGLDVVSGMPRFAFGVPQLLGGFDFIVLICGMFGLAEVFNSIEQREDEREAIKGKLRLRDMFLTWEDWVASRVGDRAGQRHRILDRNDPRGRHHDRIVHRVPDGEALRQTSRAVRAGGDRRAWLHPNLRTTRPPSAALRPCWRWGFPGPPRRPSCWQAS